MNPGRLAVKITSADGRVTRWGGEEPDAAAIPEGLSFQTGLPGGFKSLSCSLRRDDRESRGDLDRLDNVKVYGPGGEIAWEGRQAEFPRRTGDDYSVDVDAVGHSAHLLDDPSFREIYVDRQPGGWGEPPGARMASLASSLTVVYGNDFSVTTERGVSFNGVGDHGIPAGSCVEAWYRCPVGLRVARFDYDGEVHNTTGMEAPTLYSTDTEDGASFDSDALTLDESVREQALTPARRFLMLRARRSSGGTPTNPYKAHYRVVGVHGEHGLTPEAIVDDLDGYRASAVIRDIVTRAAPLLDPSGVVDSSFVISHLVFPDATTAEEAILTVNGFDLNDWGVYEGPNGPRFFWRDPLSFRRRWIVRRDEGADFEDAGEVAETAVNGVLVQFTDVTGETRFAGPPGSGFDYEDASLADTDPTNVVNAHGIPRKWGRLDVKYTSNAAGAIRLGGKWLEGQSVAPQRGSVTAVGDVIDADSRARVPAWSVRAGDSIRVEDDDNTERRIVETSYSHDDGVLSATLDNAPFRLDAMMERLGVVLVGVEG